MKSSIILSVEPEVKPLGLGGDFERNAEFIAELGFDGAELSIMNVGQVDTKKIRKIAERYQLAIPAIGSGRYYAQHGLSLSTSDSGIRKKATDSVKESLRVAAELNSQFIIGIAQGKNERSYEEGFTHLKESLLECAKVAEQLDVQILLEAVTRYLPVIIKTIEEGIRMIDEVGSPSVKLLADTHHMNIEERSITESIRQAKGYLAHVHFSDSNRLAPGQGHIDFYKIAEALRDIGYEGFVSAEIQPEPDPSTAARLTIELIRSLPY
ncbi:sugar phosphate isomerase/epimerase [bacterium]|nr:sugar phosphate isomerase/epimerase [bacterium]